MPSRHDLHHSKKRISFWKWGGLLLGLVLAALIAFVFIDHSATQTQKGQEVKASKSSTSYRSSSRSVKKSESKNSSAPSTSQSATNDNNNSQSSSQNQSQVISSDLVGSWQGQTPFSNYNVTMTFQENGQIDITVDQNSYYFTISGLRQIAPGLYLYQDVSPADKAYQIIPGAEIGGTGAPVKLGYGVSVNGDTIKPVFWQISPEEDFTSDNMARGGYHGEFTLSRLQ